MTFVSQIRTQIASMFGKGAACARFCEQLFPAGSARTQCVRDGANHTDGNLCDACENDVSRACKGPTGAVVCCAPLQVCDQYRGECV